MVTATKLSGLRAATQDLVQDDREHPRGLHDAAEPEGGEGHELGLHHAHHPAA